MIYFKLARSDGMFKHKTEKMKVPAHIWMDKSEFANLTDKTKQQIENLGQLPFVYDHISIMPDAHQGYGVPIGTVFASKDAVVINGAGSDIGCGMVYLETNIPAKLLRETETGSGSLAQMLSGSIRRDIPTGYKKHGVKQENAHFDAIKSHIDGPKPLLEELEVANYSLKTLGGGNHFIQYSEDQNGMLSIMIHSGSRHLGYVIAEYFNDVAKKLNKKWLYRDEYYKNLSFLPINSKEGKEYLRWMYLALAFARQNRKMMLDVAFDKLKKNITKYTGFKNIEVTKRVNAHHNYCDIENHFGENVYVHRKGAIRARKKDWGIIPGSMGSASYIVKGKQSNDSFHSASHGAGRTLGRREAKDKYSVQEVMEDLQHQQITLGKDEKEDVAEEYKLAYKDIDKVIENEKDLVEPRLKLKPVVVIKG
jgi:tRNA-splicing ligase RtcB